MTEDGGDDDLRSLEELWWSVATRNVLEDMQVSTIRQLVACSTEDILEAERGTRHTVAEVRAILAEQGLALRGDPAVEVPRDDPWPPPGDILHDASAVAAPPPVHASDTLVATRRGRALALTFLGERAPAAPSACAEALALVAREAPPVVIVECDLAWPGAAFADGCRDLASVEAFVFDTGFQSPFRQAENTLGRLDRVLAACPNATRCYASGAVELEPFTHDALTELYLIGDPLPAAVARALAASRLPRLERIALSPSTERDPTDLGAFVAAVAALAPVELHVEVADSASLARWTAVPTPRRISFDFVAPIDQDELSDLLAGLPAPELSERELGLPLAATCSRHFTRQAIVRWPWLRDNAAWPWASCLPAVYAGW